jgi:hypothetical protein
MAHLLNAELGSDATISELVQRLENFNWNTCALTDAGKVIQAVRLLAEDNVRRHKLIVERERALAEREHLADILDKVEQTVAISNPSITRKPKYFWR